MSCVQCQPLKTKEASTKETNRTDSHTCKVKPSSPKTNVNDQLVMKKRVLNEMDQTSSKHQVQNFAESPSESSSAISLNIVKSLSILFKIS